jgi:hypothetical protein
MLCVSNDGIAATTVVLTIDIAIMVTSNIPISTSTWKMFCNANAVGLDVFILQSKTRVD